MDQIILMRISNFSLIVFSLIELPPGRATLQNDGGATNETMIHVVNFL